MTSIFPVPAFAQTTVAKECATLRVENGWTRAQYRECRRSEVQANIDRLDAEFAEMRDWLRARGLDLNDAGRITDSNGRILAQIEASNAALAAGNAALRADIGNLKLSIQTSRAEYRQILQEFERSVLQSQ